MKVGDKVTFSFPQEVIDSKITYKDAEKSCGWVSVTPLVKKRGHILGFKSGWFCDYWIVGFEDGSIENILA